MAPYVMAAIGDHPDVKKKLIVPYMKSFARIEGSKLEAREFISGESRKAFQDRVFEGLLQQCSAQGIEIRATLIRRIEPPDEIANPISDRQVAEQQIAQYQNEIKLAESQARLVEQEEMQQQNQEIGEADREVVTMTIQAEQSKAVALTEANKQFEVAKLDLEAARETAAALVSRGEAAAEVILLDYEAEANPLRDAINAFGGGEAYAQYFFYQKLGPALKSVLASTEGPFADIFRSLSNPAEAGRANPGPSPE
jgi:regulator of protease activity HflC (stomatin/prohibitin superfamily)